MPAPLSVVRGLRPLLVLTVVLALAAIAASCGGDEKPPPIDATQATVVRAAREQLDDALDTEETLRTSKVEARRLRRDVQRIVSGGAFENDKLDEFGLAALGKLNDLVPSLVLLNERGVERNLDRPATRAFLAYAERDPARALVQPATAQVGIIEQAIRKAKPSGDQIVPQPTPTAPQPTTVNQFLTDIAGDLKPAWPQLAARLTKLRDGLK